MGEESAVYDLGELEHESVKKRGGVVRKKGAGATRARASHRPRSQGSAPRKPVDRRTVVSMPAGLPGSLSLFLPGAGQVARGNWSGGFLFLVMLGFVVASAWALAATVERLTGTMVLLGYSRAVPVWVMGGLYVAAAGLHITAVYRADARGPDLGLRRPPHPFLSGLASAVVPGWGQILNGNRGRAVLLLGAIWSIAMAWILSLDATDRMLASLGLYLPAALQFVSSPMLRWTFPAVVWSLAVYDAAASAALRRRSWLSAP
jgi:hypothetical protein